MRQGTLETFWPAQAGAVVLGVWLATGTVAAGQPLPEEGAKMQSNVQVLGGAWTLATDPENKGREQRWFERAQPGAQPVPVPGVIQQVFPNYQGVAWYWLTFRAAPPSGSAGVPPAERTAGVPPAPAGGTPALPAGETPAVRSLVHFGAVDYLAEVWLNGTHAGTFEGGETPFEFDVTSALKADGDNLLAVRVLNTATKPIDGYVLNQTPHRNKVVPPKCGSAFNSGGIMSLVELRYVPAVYITDVFAHPDAKTGAIAVSVSIRNSLPAATASTLALGVAPSAGGDLLQSVQQQLELPPGESQHELAVTLTQPRLWNLDDPFLYRVTAAVTAKGAKTHEYAVRCGFRDFRVVDGWFMLNGKRIFLKSTHTGNCTPIGQVAPVIPDYVRRDMIFAKASGFNTVRFIAGAAYPEQLDFCDELGLMVYEECYAAWCLEDSPKMGERFDHSTSEMVRRDRNHPSVAIWGLLNETHDGPVFRRAVEFLPKLRQLDPTRLVLLSSGRWDAKPAIGSVSNPGSNAWEPVWGVEGPEVKAVPKGPQPGGYVGHPGDAHVYPATPHTAQTCDFIRGLGRETKPVFLSEYGIGSMMNVISEWRHFEQAGARPDLMDAAMLRAQSEALCADWKRLGFDGVYPFPEDLLRESQRLHSRQRTLGFDLIRSNPKLCGFNLTGILDHAITGEGLWTFWREWKPGTFDAVSDGWSPLRWCLFVDPSHGYSGHTFTVEAVLATEDALRPGDYPARFRVCGENGVVWEKTAVVKIPDPAPLAVPAIRETIKLEAPAGRYVFAASLESGGAPTGGRLAFYLSDAAALPRAQGEVVLWGVEKKAEDWLTARGLACRQLDATAPAQRELVLVGKPADAETNPKAWEALTQRLAQGSTVIFLSAKPFREGKAAMQWLPLQSKGRCRGFNDWLYHKECVAKRSPVFAGLQGPGIMDWDYYGPVIPHDVFEKLDTPQETLAAAFASGYYEYPNGYGCSLLMAAYKSGAGRFVLSTPYILENLDAHPAADRLLLNLVQYGR